MCFVDLFGQNWRKTGKTGPFCPLVRDLVKMARFSCFSPILVTSINKTHKITSLEDSKWKIFSQKFQSHGMSLGSMGPQSQKALGLGPCQLQIIIVWAPYKPPALWVLETHAKNLNHISVMMWLMYSLLIWYCCTWI